MNKISTLLSNPYPQTLEGFILMDVELQGIKQGLVQGIEQGIEKGVEQGKLEGKREGELEGKESVALNLLQYTNMSIEEIVLFSGLEKERVQKLKASIKTDITPIISVKPINKTFFQKVKMIWKNWLNKLR